MQSFFFIRLVCFSIIAGVIPISSLYLANDLTRSNRLEVLDVTNFISVTNEENAISTYHEYLLKPLQHSLNVYVRALTNSVKLMKTMITRSQEDAIYDCKYSKKPPLFYHQHSLELRYPLALHEMSIIHSHPDEFSNREGFGLMWEENLDESNGTSVFNEPLFYYLESFHYFVVYCSYKPRGKENWWKGTTYWHELADQIVQAPEWRENMGIDFFCPASHPKQGPLMVHPWQVNLFNRQSFLRTDFDFTGNNPKDVIMPYYVADNPDSMREFDENDPFPETPNNTLIFFSGRANPPNGIRSLLSRQFQDIIAQKNYTDIVFTTDPIDWRIYRQHLQNSDFCLTVRGDTASSSRFFATIRAGCIPVIISDFLKLPFDSIIDYSKFVIKFPESIQGNVDLLVRTLRSISDEKKLRLSSALQDVQSMLTYPPDRANYHLYNPITLSLIELFINKQKYCEELEVLESNTMCVKLRNRLAIAVEMEAKIKI